ncbi:MAG: hypothetical protein LBQ22_04960 [Bacteroidales bacterium]|nr:hypothetical protein [Bacteroidales bacterium]
MVTGIITTLAITTMAVVKWKMYKEGKLLRVAFIMCTIIIGMYGVAIIYDMVLSFLRLFLFLLNLGYS